MQSRRHPGLPTSWIGWLFEWRPKGWTTAVLSYVLPAVLVASLLFFLGWVVAYLGGFGLRYVTSREIIALAGATGWVFAWGAWSTDALRALPHRIRPALRLPQDGTYDRLIQCWYRWVFAAWPNFLLGGLWLCLALWPVWKSSGWLDWLPTSWDDPDDRRMEQVILTLYFAVGSPLFITMLWGFFSYVYFAWRAVKYRLALTPSLARTRLRPITLFGLWTGLGWSIAVSLGLVFFARDLSYVVATFLIGLTVMGFALIISPQLFVHNALIRTRDELVIETASHLHADEAGQWVDQYVVNPGDGAQRARVFLGELQTVPVWIYSPGQALTLLAEALLPIAITLLLNQA